MKSSPRQKVNAPIDEMLFFFSPIEIPAISNPTHLYRITNHWRRLLGPPIYTLSNKRSVSSSNIGYMKLAVHYMKSNVFDVFYWDNMCISRRICRVFLIHVVITHFDLERYIERPKTNPLTYLLLFNLNRISYSYFPSFIIFLFLDKSSLKGILHRWRYEGYMK